MSNDYFLDRSLSCSRIWFMLRNHLLNISAVAQGLSKARMRNRATHDVQR